MIIRHGVIYQTLDLKERAWHATISNTRSIGIEIANIGSYLVGQEDIFHRWYIDVNGTTKIILPRNHGVLTPGWDGGPLRGPITGHLQGQTRVQYDFTWEQYAGLAKLTAALVQLFPRIELRFPIDSRGEIINQTLSAAEFAAFHGILGHFHVQTNKQDPGPAFQWDKLMTDVKQILQPNQ